MSTHKITTQVEHKFDFGSPIPGEYEVAYPTLEIEYRYSPGYTPKTPRGEYGPIDPPEGPEVEFISAKVIDTDFLTIDDAKAREIAEEWLDDAGRDEAIQHAELFSGPDPDEAYERRRDADRVDGFDRDDLGESHD